MAAAAFTCPSLYTFRHSPFSDFTPQISLSKPSNAHPFLSPQRRCLRISSSVSAAAPEVQTGPDDLAASILSKVSQSDRGVLLSGDQHKEVAEIAQELQKYCIDAPVKCPLIFGEWDVVYCSRPTSPGGGYRSAFGRLIFRAKEMIQVVDAPDTVINKVSFSALGFLDGEVSLKGFG
ncbi:Probable plastid-lipid-associated protein 8, chloroplastic [Ancistrocladus abbreviatus]